MPDILHVHHSACCIRNVHSWLVGEQYLSQCIHPCVQVLRAGARSLPDFIQLISDLPYSANSSRAHNEALGGIWGVERGGGPTALQLSVSDVSRYQITRGVQRSVHAAKQLSGVPCMLGM